MVKAAFLGMVVICSFGVAKAQYDPLFLQYQEALPYYNPAAIGISEEVQITALYNRQWIGVEGAPNQFSFLAHAPWALNALQGGVGLFATSQRKGLYTHTELHAEGASRWRIGQGHFSVGMQLGLYNSMFDGTQVKLIDGENMSSNDPAIPLTRVNGKTFDMGSGIYWHHPSHFLGIGARHILPTSVELSTNYFLYLPLTINFVGGYNIISENSLLSWHPKLFAVSDFHSYRVDLNLDVKYAQKLEMGLVWRPMSAAGLRFGLHWGKFRMGYAFDMPTSALMKNNWGSHEVVVSYSFPLTKGKEKKVSQQSIWLL